MANRHIEAWTDASVAVGHAHAKGVRLKSGFFLIAVKEPGKPLHDVLVLNLEKFNFSSLQESRAQIEEEPAIWENRDKIEPTVPVNDVKINPHENTLKDAVEFRNNYEHVEETASPKEPVKKPSHF